MQLSASETYVIEFDYWADEADSDFTFGLYAGYTGEWMDSGSVTGGTIVKHAKIELSSDSPNMAIAGVFFAHYQAGGSVYIANIRFYNKEAVESRQLLDARNAVSEKDFQYFYYAEKVPMYNAANGKTDEVLVIPPIVNSVATTWYMNLSQNEEYVLEFRYWGDVDGDIVITDLFPDDLPETCLTVQTSAQWARLVISSGLANMSNALLRFFVNDGYGHTNTGNVYVADIRFYKKADLGKAAVDANPYRYCGEYWDDETGTYYLRARYYDPVTSRIIRGYLQRKSERSVKPEPLCVLRH
jgi:RHS repeat-associated protein